MNDDVLINCAETDPHPKRNSEYLRCIGRTGRLQWQAATLKAVQSCCTCRGYTCLIAVTGLHRIRIDLLARFRTFIGLPCAARNDVNTISAAGRRELQTAFSVCP
jgi:hypothetical protein